MADTIEIIQGTATTVEVAGPTGPQGPAGAAGATGAQGPQGVPGTGLEVLSVQGDLLYQGASTGQRLPIGTTGQVLKVAGGIPSWANESGAVSSVAGKTGVVTLDKNDVGLSNVANTAQVTSVTGTAPIVSSGGTTPAISISAATTSAAGSMSSADKTKLDGIASGAEVNVNADWNASSGDAQILNKPTSLAPTAHAASHAAAGSDPLAPSDIGAQSIFVTESLVLTSATRVDLTAARAKLFDVVQYAGATATVRLPDTGSLVGDVFIFRWGTGSDSVNVQNSVAPYSVLGNVSLGQQLRFIRGSVSWTLVPVDTHAHAAADISDSTTAGRALLTGADASAQRTTLGLGTAATSATGDFAAASHSHGNLTNDGKVGSTSGLPLVTTTAGAVTTLALGTAGQILRTKSDLSGVEFADPAAAGVTSVTGTAPIVSSGGTTPAISVTVGTGANTVCAGDDARLSDARIPTSHSHGNLTNAGAIGSTAGLPVVTTTSGAVTTLALGSANQVLKVNSGGTAVEFGAAGGVTSGSVDNAILRADGTGGSTSQSSDLVIDDATTSTQNNVALRNNHSQTDSALVLTPKGTGAFIVGPKPDGTSTGGNARGSGAICIQTSRTAATQVASTTDSIAIGNRSTSSSSLGESVAIGPATTASGSYSTCVGGRATATNTYACALGHDADATFTGATALGNRTSATNTDSIAIGTSASCSGAYSVSIGRDQSVTATSAFQFGSFLGANSALYSCGFNTVPSVRAQFATLPFSAVYWGGQTTDGTANVELNLDATATNRMTIAANTAVLADIYVVARQTDNSRFLAARRWVAIRRDGSNNTALIGAVQTIETDQSEGSPTWTFTIDADDTAAVETLRVRVTGTASQTVNWRVMALYRVVA